MVTSRPSARDLLFRASFEAGQISPSVFNHRGHLRLAYIYLCENEFDVAYGKMKNAIEGFLQLSKVDPVKYHETLTVAWIQAVRHFMEMAGSTMSFDEFIDTDDRLLDTDIMLSHYSRERLFSTAARQSFLSPDIQPIPLY